MTMGTRTCRVLRIAVLSQPTDEELRYVGQPYRALAIGQSHEPRRMPGWMGPPRAGRGAPGRRLARSARPVPSLGPRLRGVLTDRESQRCDLSHMVGVGSAAR